MCQRLSMGSCAHFAVSRIGKLTWRSLHYCYEPEAMGSISFFILRLGYFMVLSTPAYLGWFSVSTASWFACLPLRHSPGRKSLRALDPSECSPVLAHPCHPSLSLRPDLCLIMFHTRSGRNPLPGRGCHSRRHPFSDFKDSYATSTSTTSRPVGRVSRRRTGHG